MTQELEVIDQLADIQGESEDPPQIRLVASVPMRMMTLNVHNLVWFLPRIFVPSIPSISWIQHLCLLNSYEQFRLAQGLYTPGFSSKGT